MIVFLLQVLAQALALAAIMGLAGKPRAKAWEAQWLFQPVNWLALWYCLQFGLTQLALWMHGFPLLGFEGYTAYARLEAAVHAQSLLVIFLCAALAGVVIGTFIFRSSRRANYGALVTGDWDNGRMGGAFKSLALFAFVSFGLAGLLFLASTFDGGARSALVKTPVGQVAYALSFAFSFGASVIAARQILRGRHLWGVVIIAAAGAALLVLGGRGRVLWPIVHVAVFVMLIKSARVRPLRLGLLLSVLFVLLSALDPLYLYLRGEQLSSATERFLAALDVSRLFLQRTFDSFHNFALIVYRDAIPPDPSVLFGGSGRVFMGAYFSEVLARGVGFPASLPGELWIAGKWVGLTGGGLALGLLIAVLQRWYWGLRSESALWAYVVAVPMLTGIGYAYLDQTLKVVAAVTPTFVLHILERTLEQGRRTSYIQGQRRKLGYRKA